WLRRPANGTRSGPARESRPRICQPGTHVTRPWTAPPPAQIAKLARDGHTNQEIAAQLYINPRIVEWHLGNVFTKLGITSREDLRCPTSRCRWVTPQKQPTPASASRRVRTSPAAVGNAEFT